MTCHPPAEDGPQPHAKAADLQTMSELIQRYPAEAQLIIAALEDGLRIGPMQAMPAD